MHTTASRLGLKGKSVVLCVLLALALLAGTGMAYLGLTRQAAQVQRLAGVDVEQLMASTRFLQQADLLTHEGRLLARAQTHAERRQGTVGLADRLEWVRRLVLEMRAVRAEPVALGLIDDGLRQMEGNATELDDAVRRRVDAPDAAHQSDVRRLLERHEALAGTLSAQVGMVATDMRRQLREQAEQLVSNVEAQRRQLIGVSVALLGALLLAALYLEYRVVRRVLRLKRMVDAGDVRVAAVGPAGSDEIASLAETVDGYIRRLHEHEREMARANQDLAFLADHDALTQLPNRRHFEAASLRLLRASRMPVFVIAGDLDHFKRVNDGWGHAAGDLALVHTAACLRAGLRDGELLARMGGEEFVALVPAHTPSEALVLANRMRMRLADAPLELPSGETVPLSISFGLARVATMPPQADDAMWRAALEEALSAADGALYTAKHAGRNRAELAAPRIGLVGEPEARHAG